MTDFAAGIKELPREEKVLFFMDLLHRIAVHHGLWFSECIHQFGMERALSVLFASREKSLPIQMDRLSRVLGFSQKNGVPEALQALSPEKMDELLQATAVNWLANDGVWFQAVEFSSQQFDAKRANDTCWTRFSPFEAESIKRFLKQEENPGLPGLARALSFRLYALVNTQAIRWEGTDSFVFSMENCRVQDARKRRGLPDYPCKSGGMAEYPAFALTIDPRIRTECLACPPDRDPDGPFCAWRFFL
ncbi:MAG: DUF6125 family protein [Thermodesulfobacteriota bacterium]